MPDNRPNLRSLIFLIVCAALLIAPLGLTDWHAQGALKNERRKRSEWPTLPRSAAEWKDFPEQYNQALQDRVGLRDQAREAWAAIHYFLLSESVDPRVIVGQGPWLFYADKPPPEHGHVDEVADAVESELMPSEKLESVLEKIQSRYQWALEHGVVYRLAVAPNKTTLYREYAPAWMTPRGRGRPVNQLEQAFQGRFGEAQPWLNLEPALRPVRDSTNIFYLTDTHWNELGAYHGVAAIMQNLAPELPGLRQPRLEDFSIQWATWSRFDLARMLGLPSRLHENRPFFTPKPDIDLPDFQRNMKVLVYSDSFGGVCEPIWKAYFPNSEFHIFRRFDRKEIEAEQAKLVLSIMVERNLRDRVRYW